MILVLLGTNPYSFSRLIKPIDIYALKSGKEIIIQLGHSNYIPKHADYFSFKSHKEITKLIKSAEFIITQGGFGSIYDCLNLKKKIICVPRQRELDECLDSGLGQVELVQYLEKGNRILALYDVTQLEEIIEKVDNFEPDFIFYNNLALIVSQILSGIKKL